MGNQFSFSIVGDDEVLAEEKIDLAIKEVIRIEYLLTTYNEHSQTSQINANAGIAPVAVDREVFELILRAKKISDISQGAFDLSYGSIDKSLWNFDTKMISLPDAETARQSVRLINYKNIVVDEKRCTVFLREKGMRIGFGGIGKGYAADRVKNLLQKEGVKNGIVNAAGDLVTWGAQPDGKPWTAGIADPNQRETPFSWLNISNRAIATSGSYEKFAIIDGIKYSHTIDPKTGFPVHGIKSVSIICPSAELADALATPVMVMGIRAGLDMIDQLNSVACVIIDEKDKLYMSQNIRLK